MTTSTSMRYNDEVIDTTKPEFVEQFKGFTNTKAQQHPQQAERVPIFCKTTKKLLGRVSLDGEWPAELRQWLWCRGCHVEHEVTKEQVEEARTFN